MKKYLIALFVLLFASPAFGADACAYKKRMLSAGGIREYVWEVNLDATTGADCSGDATSDPIYGYIVGFKVLHESAIGTGGTSPASTYDLELRDGDAYDWMFGEMASGSTSETDSGNVDVPVTDSGGLPPLHGERLYPFITDADNAAAYDLTIYLRVKEK